jgi:hypothetical protein
VALLNQVKGMGTLIALTFLLTLEDAHRVRKPLCVIQDSSKSVDRS